MARPLKSGLDYFPLDVSFDDTVELIEAECGLQGFAILIKLWQKIYSSGYFIEWNTDTILLFTKKINSEIELVNSVINACFNRNLFDKSMHERYKILTSVGIQKRYLAACVTSKRKNITMHEKYLLLEDKQKALITDLIKLIPEETPVNSGESTQRKGKEIERKRNDIYKTAQSLSISKVEYEKLVSIYGQSVVDNKIEQAENYKGLDKKYTSLYLTLNNWLKADAKEDKPRKEGTALWKKYT